MADAKKCDRCGDYFTPNTAHEPTRFSVRCKDGQYRRKDLCHNCMEELDRWFKEGEQDGNYDNM